MQSITVKTFAKINFNLNITGLDYKNYHLLDSIVASIGIFDIITVTKNSTDNIIVENDNQEIQNTIAYNAATLFKTYFKTQGFNIKIINQIPSSGGLGGSSADAAGVLNALSVLFEIPDSRRSEVFELSKKSGSDTSYMLTGGFARMRGTGEIIDFFNCEKVYNIVIAKPDNGVNSGHAFKLYDEMVSNVFVPNSTSEKVVSALQAGNMELLKQNCLNDLYIASSKIVPEIAKIKEFISSFEGVGACFMSGSGSSVVGIFESEEKCSKCSLELINKGYYSMITKSQNKGFEITNVVL